MNKREELICKLWIALIWIFIILILGGFIALTIYVYVSYGSKPISEVPAWALPWFFRRQLK